MSEVANGGKELKKEYLYSELMSPVSRLLTWNEKKGRLLSDEYLNLLRGAKRVAYVSCHGDTYGDDNDRFWALSLIDAAFGADRVVKAIIDTARYDLIIMTACNPDGLPLAAEAEGQKRPTIIRFNVTNDYDIPEHVEPIKIIPNEFLSSA